MVCTQDLLHFALFLTSNDHQSPKYILTLSPQLAQSSPSPSSSRSFSQSSGEQACRRAWRWRAYRASVVFGAHLGEPRVPSASLPASLPPSACSQRWCCPRCTCGKSSSPARLEWGRALLDVKCLNTNKLEWITSTTWITKMTSTCWLLKVLLIAVVILMLPR